MDFNTFFSKLKQWENQNHMFVVNKDRMKKVEQAYDIFEEIIHTYSPDAKVEMEINTPISDGSAVIWAETDELIVKNIGDFVTVIQNADNFEIYPMTDGNIKIAITFQNVMTLIK